MTEPFDAEVEARAWIAGSHPLHRHRETPSLPALLTRAHEAGRREGIEEAADAVAHTILGGRQRMAAVRLMVDRIRTLLTPESDS